MKTRQARSVRILASVFTLLTTGLIMYSIHTGIEPKKPRTASICHGDFTFPKLYGDGMVLQAAPERGKIFGFAFNTGCPVNVLRTCTDHSTSQNHTSAFHKSKRSYVWIWELELPPVPNGVWCKFNVTQGDLTKTLTAVYGDVWVCAGQSNLLVRMTYILNGTQEIEEAARYTNIRIFRAETNASSVEQDDLIQVRYPWQDTTNEATMSQYSALCFLYAKYLTDKLGQSHVFGLMDLSVGATPIEAWMPQEALDQCRVPDAKLGSTRHLNSDVWNSLVHPVLRNPVKGVLWSQGYNNVPSGNNLHLYNCTFPSLIASWRRRWLNQFLPFGFEHLRPLPTRLGVEPNQAELRWHQTADLGQVPNSRMPNVFMAVSVDVVDEQEYLEHPRLKQAVAQRLSMASANLVYHLRQYPTGGPFPSLISPRLGTDGTTMVQVSYNQTFRYDSSRTSGFYACCAPSFGDCDADQAGFWKLLSATLVAVERNTILVNLTDVCGKTPGNAPVGMGFLYENVPLKENLANPIYSDDQFRMPAAPWKAEL